MTFPRKALSPTLGKFLKDESISHHLECGDCLDVLRSMPTASVDCVVTSPPYWRQREYEHGKGHDFVPLGDEESPADYVRNLVEIFDEIKRVLTPNGSIWVNLGDKYQNKNLMGMPWRVALALQDRGWILRSDVIWDQMKGTESVKDRLRCVHEYIFHLVKNKKYYYNADKIRIKLRERASVKNGTLVSATGVSGKKYYRQIAESKVLTDTQKFRAKTCLDKAIAEMRAGEIIDFRMTVKGCQRAYHSDSKKVSGRAKELEQKGFYILKMGANGFIPSTIWRIVPEDQWRTDSHYAVFPETLLEIPIKATCPPQGIVLDPFSGTGSTVLSAVNLGFRGLGLELSEVYHEFADTRINKACRQKRLISR